jgi:hypothetical protein
MFSRPVQKTIASIVFTHIVHLPDRDTSSSADIPTTFVSVSEDFKLNTYITLFNSESAVYKV